MPTKNAARIVTLTFPVPGSGRRRVAVGNRAASVYDAWTTAARDLGIPSLDWGLLTVRVNPARVR